MDHESKIVKFTRKSFHHYIKRYKIISQDIASILENVDDDEPIYADEFLHRYLKEKLRPIESMFEISNCKRKTLKFLLEMVKNPTYVKYVNYCAKHDIEIKARDDPKTIALKIKEIADTKIKDTTEIKDAPEDTTEEIRDTDVEIKKYKNATLVTGEGTRSHIEKFKQMDGKWNNKLKGWIFSASKYDQVKEYIDSQRN